MFVLFLCGTANNAAYAQSCSPAASQGAAPASWQSYCWLDFSSYNDTIARSASGQNLSFNLSDGSVLSFNIRTTATSGGVIATPAPSWSGAAVGNTSFLGIPGNPILYNTGSGANITFQFTGITITPPPGVSSVTDYSFVFADGESTDNSEILQYQTNGDPWELLDTVDPISGSNFPTITGIGTTVATSSGNGLPSPIGAHIVGSANPTTTSVFMDTGGLQGIMVAIRFASITLDKQIVGGRIDPSDQFDFEIQSTSSGTALASGTTTGTGLGPFPSVALATASGIPITISETIAAGSASALSQYQSSLTCTNANTGSSTPLPTNVITTNFDFGSLAFGDIVSCRFTNTPFPHVTVSKALGTGGRIFDSDQFTLRLRQGATVAGSTTTTGSGTTITNGSIGPQQVVIGTNYQIDEVAAGTTNLSRYTDSLSCSNAFAGSSSTLPSSINSDFSLALGDVVTCTLTNIRDAANASLRIEKTSQVISDPVSAANPKAIPESIVRYSITVTNEGDAPVDFNSLFIFDVLPANMTYSVAPFVTFSEGPTPSGLNSPALDINRVLFSNQPSGGGPYNYTPVGSFDSDVTGVRIRPRGQMAASDGINHPSFTVSFEMRVD